MEAGLVIREIDKEAFEMVSEILGDTSASSQALAKYREMEEQGIRDIVIGVCVHTHAIIVVPRADTSLIIVQ